MKLWRRAGLAVILCEDNDGGSVAGGEVAMAMFCVGDAKGAMVAVVGVGLVTMPLLICC